MHKAYIALGSNLKNPALQIKCAFKALSQLPQTQLAKQSSLYQTAPIGYDNQPNFVNAVALLNTFLMPKNLLDALLSIEQTFGRERPFANAPRILDLDLLLYDDQVFDTPELTIPHPRMHERAFVLAPLAEIAPQLTLPNHGSVVELAEKYKNQGIVRL